MANMIYYLKYIYSGINSQGGGGGGGGGGVPVAHSLLIMVFFSKFAKFREELINSSCNRILHNFSGC